MSGEDICIQRLDQWIVPKKREIHEKHIKAPNNSPLVLQNYMNELKQLYNDVCLAFRESDSEARDTKLRSLGWPDDLIECTKEINTRTDVADRLKLWCKTYTQNPELLNEQIQNNEITNTE